MSWRCCGLKAAFSCVGLYLLAFELQRARIVKPVAVMVNYERYSAEEQMLDFAEEYILGCLAFERDKSAHKNDFVDIEKW